MTYENFKVFMWYGLSNEFGVINVYFLKLTNKKLNSKETVDTESEYLSLYSFSDNYSHSSIRPGCLRTNMYT